MDPANSEQPPAAVLYYDGRCPLCMKEMARLGSASRPGLQLADIHAVEPADGMPDRETLLRNLHLRLPDGRWLTGVEANVAAWGYTEHGRWLRWMRWPLIRTLADFVYVRWARWRYERLYAGGCNLQEDSCHAPD